MSLMLMKEPETMQARSVAELRIGTWFIDSDQQIYLVALDDRTNERRIICIGSYYHPFIVNIPTEVIDIERVLPTGTTFHITEIMQGVVDHV